MTYANTIATAVATYFILEGNDEADIAIEAALLDVGVMVEDDQIMTIDSGDNRVNVVIMRDDEELNLILNADGSVIEF